MTLARDMQELMHRVRRTPGYTVRISKNGHWQVRDMDDHLLVTASSTPSDWRALKKVTAHLRQAGVPLNGELQWEKRVDDEPPEQSQLPASQERLVANINAYLADQGHEPGARDGLRAEFTREMMRVAKQRNMRPFKSMASAETTLSSLIRHGRGVTPWVEALMTETLETIWAEKEQAELEKAGKEEEARKLAQEEQAREQATAARNEKQVAEVKALRSAKKTSTRKRPVKKTVREGIQPYVITSSSTSASNTAVNSGNSNLFAQQLDLCLRLQMALIGGATSPEDARALVQEVGQMFVR